jgi:hypothetical protein
MSKKYSKALMSFVIALTAVFGRLSCLKEPWSPVFPLSPFLGMS